MEKALAAKMVSQEETVGWCARRGEDGDIVVINSWMGELNNPDLLLRKADLD